MILLAVTLILTFNSYAQQPVYKDIPFWQDKSESYFLDKEQDMELSKIFMDRNEVIRILSSKGLIIPFKGKLVVDRSYHPMMEMSISGMEIYKNQFVYLTDKVVLSNAWAGKIYIKYSLPKAKCFAGGDNFKFLVGSDDGLQYVGKNGQLWSYTFDDRANLRAIKYDAGNNGFWILSNSDLSFFDPSLNEIVIKYTGNDLTSFEVLKNGNEIVIGTVQGYQIFNKTTNKITKINKRLPWNELTCLAEINGNLWFGSTQGAFMLREDGKFNYYASRRWLADDHVKHISSGTNNTVLILTSKGMSKILFNKITLEEKAMHYEKQVRKRHIRNGLISENIVMSEPGNLSTGQLEDSDNDGLWTSMYLGSQLFRYAVTKSDDAYQNALESFDAIERLFRINSIKGFPSRSFERHGYNKEGDYQWNNKTDPNWSWKGTTSSDEAVGHYFALCLVAEIIEDISVKKRAIQLIEDFTDHLIDNDLYLIDADGKPTEWGRWNPESVNGLPKNEGDRKLNSLNIISFLQAGYHFTGKEIYKKKANELLEKYGYLENLLYPIEDIGKEHGWNHSDDEMYFLSFWYLYPYAFTKDLQSKYEEVMKEMWNIERPEKNGLWNFCYAQTGTKDFDLDESIWFLKEYPLDLISWNIKNSHRKDIDFLPMNYREQTTKEILPPDERPTYKHNTNYFVIDRSEGGSIENSGDLFLLPYWMGRYLNVISAPIDK